MVYYNKWFHILMRPKDKVIKERVVCSVYYISCDSCDDSYIGEAVKFLQATFMETELSDFRSFKTCEL